MNKILLIIFLCTPIFAKITCNDVFLDISKDAVKTLSISKINKEKYQELLQEYFEIYMGLRPYNKENQKKVTFFQKLMQKDDFVGYEIKGHLDQLFEDFRTKNSKKNYAIFNQTEEINILVHPKKDPLEIKKPLIVIIDWDQKPISKKLFDAADLLLQSVDGEIPHEDSLQLSFPKVKKANFSGGYGESCLATGVASFVLTAEKAPNRSIQIVLNKKDIYFEHSSGSQKFESIIYSHINQFFETFQKESTLDTPLVIK